jgi:hypothetical protein
MATLKEAVDSFEAKYSQHPIWKSIWSVGADEAYGVIHIYTANAKIWVDLPNKHEGFPVKMNVVRKPRPAASKYQAGT